MQSVLSPIVGRLSDVLDRKYLAAIPPLIAFVGAVVSAKATSMSMLIGGGILIGVTLSTISIVQAIPSEVLPLKYRALANGFAFLGGAVGGVYVARISFHERVCLLTLILAGSVSLAQVVSPTPVPPAGGTSSGCKRRSTWPAFSVSCCSTTRPAVRTIPRCP
jgi:MFS family permease